MDKNYEHNEGHIEGRCQDMMRCAKDRLRDEREEMADDGASMKDRIGDAANSAKDKVMRAAHDVQDTTRETAHKAERAMHNKFD